MASTVELDPDLVARVKSLTPSQKDALFEAVSEDEWDGEDVIEIRRRCEEIMKGSAELLTREEFDSSVKQAMRERGLDL